MFIFAKSNLQNMGTQETKTKEEQQVQEISVEYYKKKAEELESVVKYYECLARIEELKAKRLHYMIQIAQMTAPPSSEEEEEKETHTERKLKK